MSRVALSGNPLGTGTFTIASPNSNTDRTLNLPDASGTLNTSGAPNEVPAGSAAAPAIYPAGDTNTGIFFPAADTIAFAEGGVESARFDSAGNMGIGITSPTQKLDVVGSGAAIAIRAATTSGNAAFFESSASTGSVVARLQSNVDGAWSGTLTNHPYFFQVNGSERARIDTSGNLLVGTTAANGKLNVLGSAGGTCASFNTNSSTETPVGIIVGGNNTTQAALYVYSNNNGAFNAYIFSNGNLQNRNNSYGGISDIKLKENIVDATPKLEKLQQVRVVNYNMIGEEQKQIGVIAQELEQIFPGMVEETPDRDVETGAPTGETTKSVKYSVFVPMLIKAIQEQQALIQTLTARVDAQGAEIAALKGQS